MSAGTVLVVDYHPEIVSFAKAALSHAAYDVLSARSGQDGLNILEATGGVDLAIAEVLMPHGLSGVEFVRAAKQRFPGTAVMLMTGFTEESLDPEIPLLKKPFGLATLIGRVEHVLSESRRHTEHLASTCRKLQTQFETNIDLRPEVQAAIQASRRTRDESRRVRAEFLRSRLREAGIAIPIVLVAEDDPASRYAICRFLERIGLTVLVASDGTAALEVVRQCRGCVDLLITSVRLPGLNGLELADRIAAEYPLTHIVLATGTDIEASYPVVRKPFAPEDLLAVVAGKLLQRTTDRVN